MKQAYIFIRVRVSNDREKVVKELMQDLVELETTLEVIHIFGIYDIIVKLEAEDREKLQEACAEVVSLWNVQTHMTHVIVSDIHETKTTQAKNT